MPLLAAYLVGHRGTARQAVALDIMITLTHTATVLALGAGARSTWITVRLPLLSAVVVAILGGVMTMSGLSSLAG